MKTILTDPFLLVNILIRQVAIFCFSKILAENC